MATEYVKNVAIIGCGVSGLGAAWLASRDPSVRVTLYEARSKLGGHANTVMVNGKPIDTGFLVYNENTYPNMIGLFEELGVPNEPSDMSFAVSLRNRSFEWSSGGLSGVFGTRSNIVSPSFHGMLQDMVRFNTEAPAWLKEAQADTTGAHAKITMGQFLADRKYGSPFTNWYLVPQVAAVWSASTADVLAFPAMTFIQFCVNHSLVQTMDRPQWRTVSRRSVEYVRRVAASLPPSRTTIKLNTPVTSVTRQEAAGGKTKVTVVDAHGGSAVFDSVIFGAHPDEVLGMLGKDATPGEREALGGFRYGHNTSYLHTDDKLMPARKHTWASWNYMGKGVPGSGASELTSDVAEPCCVTYWLNRLQNLPEGTPELFVTLNPSPENTPAKDKIIETLSYSHPQYTLASIAAQKAVDKLQGVKGCYYSGAYLGYGFHEDGLTSGLRAAAKLTGISPPWWNRPLHTVRAGLEGVAAAHGSAATTTPAPPAPSAVLAAVNAKKAGGGPYWEDNLGNGGPVGVATREVVKLMNNVRRAQAEVLGKRVGGVDKITQEALLGTTEQGDITGFLLQSPKDVLHTYRMHIGAGSETPVRSPSAAATGAGASGGAATLTKGKRPASPEEAGSASSENGSDEVPGSRADSSDDDASTDSGNNPAMPIPTPTRASHHGKGSKGNLSVLTSTSSKASTKASGKTSHSATLASGGIDVTSVLSGLTGIRPEVILALQERRAFKTSAVGEALTKRMKQAGTGAGLPKRSPGAPDVPVGKPVGELMSTKSGGYTGQEPPLQAPEAYGSGFAWAWQAGKNMMMAAASAPVMSFLRKSIVDGFLLLRTPDGVEHAFGNPAAEYPLRVRLRVHTWNFFIRVAAESDLGLARSFMSGEWSCDDLTALFNIFVQNRDNSALSGYGLWTAWVGMTMNYLSFAINMDNSIAGSRANIHAHYDLSNDLFTSFLDPGTMMYSCGFFKTSRRVLEDVEIVNTGATAVPNHAVEEDTGRHAGPVASSTTVGGPGAVTATPAGPVRATLEQGGQAVLNACPLPTGPTSDACFATNQAHAAAGKKMDKAVPKPYAAPLTPAPSTVCQKRVEIVYGGSLEEAQLRKLDHLIARAQVQKHDRVLDLGFGWGGLSIRLAETIGCRVHGITLSKEQHDLALERVKARGLEGLITFEIVDYRDFARDHPGEFDRIISVEMIEAVGHNYFPSYMAALDRLLAPNGLVVIQAITMPEGRYKEYIKTTDFINTIIFPGGCCPSLAALTDAMMNNTSLMLNTVDQFNTHYGETLRRWRANFNAVLDDVVRPLGFDNDFIRTWNYYLTYCEAGFSTQTLGLQVLTFTRPNNTALITARPTPGLIAHPLGEFTNTEDKPVLIPAGCV